VFKRPGSGNHRVVSCSKLLNHLASGSGRIWVRGNKIYTTRETEESAHQNTTEEEAWKSVDYKYPVTGIVPIFPALCYIKKRTSGNRYKPGFVSANSWKINLGRQK
jgi:hypothetical protein